MQVHFGSLTLRGKGCGHTLAKIAQDSLAAWSSLIIWLFLPMPSGIILKYDNEDIYC